MISVRKSFAAKLSLSILLLAVPIFVASLGVLFIQSRHLIRREAVGRANSVLTTTMQRVRRNLMTIETATNTNLWIVERSLYPDSLQQLASRIVHINPHIDGCSISLEPGVLPQYGRHFSTYTARLNDTIISTIEAEYEYFEKIWYKTPHNVNGPCWVAYSDEADSLELALDGMVASYGRPLYGADSSFVGIISTDLSLLRLSKLMSQEKPYPHSYFMMLDAEGRYFVHPDTTRLFNQTIFSGADPTRQADIIALGYEMTAGNQGNMKVNIEGADCLVCYQPVPGTGWSLAVVCPVSDVLASYHRLTYIVLPLLVVGLLVILLLSGRAVSHTIRPLNVLLEKTQTIASGNMEVYIPRSKREDVVGSLQNSFATMLQSLNFHIGSICYTTNQTQLRNEELEKATRLAEEAGRQKNAFIQNVSHQIRTPLNIIMGFSQVFSETSAEGSMPLSEEETRSITDMMEQNSKLLNRILLMLFDSSDTGLAEEINSSRHDMVPCNEVALEAISYVKLHYPRINIVFQTELADDVCLQTSRLYLMRSLREVIYNSAKYSDGKRVLVRIIRTGETVRFIVEDTGKGIAEADRDDIFKFFTKVDDLSEGLGLGLPLAKRHAQNLGGDLILDADYHNGCRFIIELPFINQ